jgi:hypothetical protein
VFEGWQRPGVAQFRQPHNFLGLGRRLLRDRAPDLYRDLLGAGAVEVEQFCFLAGAAPQPGDQDLATIGCRRPVFEAALRRAVHAEPAIELRSGCRVTGLALSNSRRAHVAGAVLAGGETVVADLVVDASGRSGRTAAWLAEVGLGPVAERSSGCGLLYYSRHFQRRDGVPDPPYASVLAGPRGDLGYLAYAIFVGDNRTFAVIIMAPPWDREFRALRHPQAYMRAARLLPGVAAWIDPDVAVPVTPVLPFGQVTNMVRRYLTGAGPVAPGLQPAGAPPRGSPDPPGPPALGWQAPLPPRPRLAPRGGYGSPGRSALQTYRRRRADELASWARTAVWRAAATAAAGMTAAAVAGWRLRFRVSRDTRAWRDGARGERATARLLRRLHRRGYVVFHDVAIPGTPANADHLLIGPPGAILVDSKRYTGQVTQTPDGRVWHNHYPMDHTLRALRLETAAISAALRIRVRPVMCVHGAQVAHCGFTACDVEILPAGRLRNLLRVSGPQQLGEADVAALVAHALSVLRPAG